MIAILLDQGLAPRAAGLLRERGIEAVHVSEIGLAAADDREILEVARTSHRVCVTLDHDFHADLALGRTHGRRGGLLRWPSYPCTTVAA